MTGTATIHIFFAPLWRYVMSGTTILRELVYDTSSGSKTLTHALYYGYHEAGSISHVTVKMGTASETFYYVKNLQGSKSKRVRGTVFDAAKPPKARSLGREAMPQRPR